MLRWTEYYCSLNTQWGWVRGGEEQFQMTGRESYFRVRGLGEMGERKKKEGIRFIVESGAE